MEFRSRELTFGFHSRDHFDTEAVKAALHAEGFANVELLSGP
jgi:hypothetical protein